MEMMNLPYMHVKKLTIEGLLDMSRQVYKNRDEIRIDLPRRTLELKKNAKRNIKLLKSLL